MVFILRKEFAHVPVHYHAQPEHKPFCLIACELQPLNRIPAAGLQCIAQPAKLGDENLIDISERILGVLEVLIMRELKQLQIPLEIIIRIPENGVKVIYPFEIV